MLGLVLSLAIAVLLSVSSEITRPPATAVVRVPNTTPFVVRGTRFKPNERVRVVAQAEGRHLRTVVATAKGAFTARFARITVGRCGGYFVRATGNKGSSASVRHMPACAEP